MVIRPVALAGSRLADGVALHAVRLPGRGLVTPQRTAHDTHAVGDHEGEVEAHAKLSDDVDVLPLALRVRLLELL